VRVVAEVAEEVMMVDEEAAAETISD